MYNQKPKTPRRKHKQKSQQYFLGSPKAKEMKEKINKWHLIKHKSFCTAKETSTKWKVNLVNGRKHWQIICPSVQFSRSVVSDSLQPHEPQHARPLCPSPTPKVYPNPCPLSRWCHPAISSFVVPFSSCPQSFPALGSFPMSQLFTWGGQSIGVSALTSILPMNTQPKGLSRVFSNTTVQKHQFFGTQLSSQFNSHIHTWPLEKPWPWLDRPLLAK